MADKPKSKGIGCLMIVVIFWNAFVLGFDGLIFRELSKQQIARQSYIAADAIVTDSHVSETYHGTGGSGRGTTTADYKPVIVYEYVVDGQQYTSDQYSFVIWGRGSPDYAKALVAQYPANSAITIFHDPDDPSISVIDRSFDEFPAVVGILLLPFHCLGLIGICFFLRMWRRRNIDGDARWIEPYIVSRSQSVTVLRDHAYPLWFIFLSTLSVTSFIMTFVLLVVDKGFNSSATTVLATLISCLVLAVFNTALKASRKFNPYYKLAIDFNTGILTRGDKTLNINHIRSVTVDSKTKMKNNKEAWYTHTARARLADGTRFDLLVAKGHKNKARVLKRSLKLELRINGDSKS